MRPLKAITDYWDKYYITEEDAGFGAYLMCSLCANTGIIDTTNSAISPRGSYLGRKNFCICPNGQMMRKIDEKKQKQAGVTGSTTGS